MNERWHAALGAAVVSSIGMCTTIIVAAPGDLTLIPLTSAGRTLMPSGINKHNQVSGEVFIEISAVYVPLRAARYDGGDSLEVLPLPEGSWYESRATGINDAGQVAGSLRSSEGRGSFRFTGAPGNVGVVESLGAGSWRSVSINQSGQVAGTNTIVAYGDERAFRYTGVPGSGGSLEDLGVFSAEEINDVGQVAGTGTQGAWGHLMRYTGAPGTHSTLEDLGSFDPAPKSENLMDAAAINNAGQIAGTYYSGWQATGGNGYQGAQAFIYDDESSDGNSLRVLGGFNRQTDARDMNASGVVVGSVAAGWWTNPVLWQNDANHTAVNLDAWLDSVNPTVGAKWGLFEASGINDRGMIVGTGWYNDGINAGMTRSFILDASSLVPEPTVLSLTAIFYIAGVRSRSRK